MASHTPHSVAEDVSSTYELLQDASGAMAPKCGSAADAPLLTVVNVGAPVASVDAEAAAPERPAPQLGGASGSAGVQMDTEDDGTVQTPEQYEQAIRASQEQTQRVTAENARLQAENAQLRDQEAQAQAQEAQAQAQAQTQTQAVLGANAEREVMLNEMRMLVVEERLLAMRLRSTQNRMTGLMHVASSEARAGEDLLSRSMRMSQSLSWQPLFVTDWATVSETPAMQQNASFEPSDDVARFGGL